LQDGAYLLDGATRVEQVEHALGVSVRESRNYATIAGFILATLASLPAPGTSLVAAGHRWTVVAMEGPRIRRVSVRRA
jgi:putative hemolysin